MDFEAIDNTRQKLRGEKFIFYKRNNVNNDVVIGDIKNGVENTV